MLAGAVIAFDLDGTLVDSAGDLAGSLAQATAATGPGVSSHTVSASTMRRLANIFFTPSKNVVARICPR